jgi:hypothetical protein
VKECLKKIREESGDKIVLNSGSTAKKESSCLLGAKNFINTVFKSKPKNTEKSA